jgi:hypothetical protein
MSLWVALGAAGLIVLCVDVLVLAALILSWRTAKEVAGPASSASRSRRRRWRRGIARLGLVAVALIPLALLNGRLLGAPFQTGPYANAYTYDARRSIPDARSVYDQGCPAQQNVLTLIVHSADVVQDTVEADAALCVGKQTFRQLWLWAGAKRAFPYGIMGSVSESVRRATFGIVYDGIHPAQTWVGQASIGQLITPPRFNASNPGLQSAVLEPVYLGRVALELVGNAGDYPLDVYSAYGTWSLVIPNGMFLGNSGDSTLTDVPVTTRILTSPGGAELNWRSDVWPNYATSPYVTLEANRSFSNLLFIIVLILLPLLLFIGVLLTFRRSVAKQIVEDARLLAGLLVGVGTFLLAVFPIRAVLVPPDVSRLTIVDYCLGTEMAVIVAGTLWLALAVNESSATGSASAPAREALLSGESKESPSEMAENASSRHPKQENATTMTGGGRSRTDGPAREDASRIRLRSWMPGRSRQRRLSDMPSDGDNG